MTNPNSTNFDPYTQKIVFYTAAGGTMKIPLNAIEAFSLYNIRISINYSCQLGASIVLFVLLLLLTHSDKRGSAVFILNAVALLFNIIRLVFQVIHFTGGFAMIYPFFSGDYSAVKLGAYVQSILGVIFQTLLVICIMASLVVQVHVVCATLRRRYRRPLLVLSVIMALVPIGFRMGWMVMNCIYIMAAASMVDLIWLESALNIVTTISVCFFCAVFVTKLGYAIRQRRQLGVRDFGPMKVIFICGCQTMTIPALFAILQYFTSVPELSSNVLTLVTISLPLSSIWAGAVLETSRRGDSSRHPPRNLWRALAVGVTPTTRNTRSTTMTTTGYTGQTMCYSEPQVSKASKGSQDSETPLGISVEHDIYVKRSRQNRSMV